jgi:hypothetical protein
MERYRNLNLSNDTIYQRWYKTILAQEDNGESGKPSMTSKYTIIFVHKQKFRADCKLYKKLP